MFPKERQRRVSWDSQSKVRIVCVFILDWFTDTTSRVVKD